MTVACVKHTECSCCDRIDDCVIRGCRWMCSECAAKWEVALEEYKREASAEGER
jgi:hypothetical protein